MIDQEPGYGKNLRSRLNMESEIEKAGLSYPVVVKAQVQIGGRGKAGGIRFADTPEEAKKRHTAW